MPLIKAYIVPHPPLIVPDIGKGEEEHILATRIAYKKIAEEIGVIKPQTIIISSPHAPSYYDYLQISSGSAFNGNLRKFNSSEQFSGKYDEELISEINKLMQSIAFPAGTLGKKNDTLDHGTMVPLYFINQRYTAYKLVRIAISGLPLKTHYEFGKLLQKVIEQSKESIVYVASGDLSHKLLKSGPYGFSEEGITFDKAIQNIVNEGNLAKLVDFNETFLHKAAECGLRSFAILAGVLDNYSYSSSLLSYEGPFGVGYLVASFNPHKKLSTETKISNSPYVELATDALKNYLTTHKKMELPKDLPIDLREKQTGVFVSIHKFHQLRGCIGTFKPTTSCIGKEIIQNAISAGTKDPRFQPVDISELPFLEISVDVLSNPIRIESRDELDVKTFGIIVRTNDKSGLLLPDLEGVDTIEQQISIALRKAGISQSDDYIIEKFTVTRYQ
jgi:AmmeMemoRadiSam system protein A